MGPRYVLIGRSGEHAKEQRQYLTDSGNIMIERQARRVRKQRYGSTTILSSLAPRARETAEIYASILGAPLEVLEELWVGPDQPLDGGYGGRIAPLMDRLRFPNTDAVLAITHYPLLKRIPNEFAAEGVVYQQPDTFEHGGLAVLDRVERRGEYWPAP